MTPCLQPEEIVDAIDGALDPARATHLASCAACRVAVADVQATLGDATSAVVPEPSPYFWATVNRRVFAAIGEAPAPRGWRAWLAWDTLVPVAGMTAVLLALGAAIARPPAPDVVTGPSPIDAVPTSPPDAVGEPADDALALVMDLAGTLPDAGRDSLTLAPLPDLGEVAAAALTDDELDALAVILRAAVGRPTS